MIYDNQATQKNQNMEEKDQGEQKETLTLVKEAEVIKKRT